MDFYQIEGGIPLRGEYRVKGAKNAALPIMAACVCCPGIHRLQDCPRIGDVYAMQEILRALGVTTTWEKDALITDSRSINRTEVPKKLMEEMRSSVFSLGSLMARCGEAKIYHPGGCRIGKRPIDLHLKGLERLGFEISEIDGEVTCRGSCEGGEITLPYPSVGATENLMMAALAGKTDTILRNCATEPEVADLAGFLRGCGFTIYGGGTETIFIKGAANAPRAWQKELRGETTYFIVEDRIEAATYLMAALGSGGRILLRNTRARLLTEVLCVLRRMGAELRCFEDLIELRAPACLRSPGIVITAPYPGFPTDCQPQLMSLAAAARGLTTVREEIFENRFTHKKELSKMGADIEICGKNAIIKGTAGLQGCDVTARDLRGGAALVLAGLMAEGRTRVSGIEHIDRGYEALHKGIRELGGVIERRTT